MRYSRYRVMDVTDGRSISNHSTLKLAEKQAKSLERNTDSRYAVIRYEWVLDDVNVVYGPADSEFMSAFEECVKPILLEEGTSDEYQDQ